jgi:hypothetical protein
MLPLGGDPMSNIRKTFIILILFTMLIGCTSGYYTKKRSTAPELGPIIVGISRGEVENYLGIPIMSYHTGEGLYRNIYEFNRGWTSKETFKLDLLDFLTFGMGEWIVTPMERYRGPKQIVSITYSVEGYASWRDRVVEIDTDLKGSHFDLISVKERKKEEPEAQDRSKIKEAQAAILEVPPSGGRTGGGDVAEMEQPQ